jgi:tRNA(His) guanylyltransferase
MKFDELEKRMRVFETAHDHCVLPGLFMVARIDGRNFTRPTREIHHFNAPFDERMRAYMVETTRHLLQYGFRIMYGYTQSDEISLIFHPSDETFGRKLRKLNSILAGEASAKFSVLLGDVAAFDCRISQLPQIGDVADYFRGRSEDAHRNALNGHCYWMLRQQRKTVESAITYLAGLSVAEKNELLFRQGVNFNELPNWQKRGIGVVWETYDKAATNRLTGEAVVAFRQRVQVEFDSRMKDEYSAWIRELIDRELAASASDRVFDRVIATQ